MKLRCPRATTLVFILVLGVFLARYAAFNGPLVHGDGHYSWIFARSLAFDGDLFLANDYALCGDPWRVGRDEGGGRPANPFYLGPAIVWAPCLKLASWLIELHPRAPRYWTRGCAGPFQRAALVSAPIAGALVVLLGGLVARRFVSERQAALAMLAVAFGTTLAHFASLVPSYSHVWAALGVALALYAWVRAREAPESASRWLLAGFSVGAAALIRAQAALMILLALSTLALVAWTPLRARRAPVNPMVSCAFLLAGFASIFGWQLVAYKLLYGHWWVIPQGRAYVQFAHAHPWLLLFAARGGLLHWTPLAWLGLLGFYPMMRSARARPVAMALVLVFAMDVYINSAPLDWHGNASYGARRLTALAAPFVLSIAYSLGVLWRWAARNPQRAMSFALLGWLAPWCVMNLGASSANVDGTVAFDRGVSAPELYSQGLRYALEPVQKFFGNPMTLPAAGVYSLRYGAQPSTFDRVATGGLFHHNYRPLFLEGEDTVDFSHPPPEVVIVEGMTRTRSGVRLRRGHRARFLVPLAWPFVTHVALDLAPLGTRALSLRARVGSFWQRRDLAVFVVPPGGGLIEQRAPPGVFDSGINEVILEADADLELRAWRFFDRGRHSTALW